MRLILPIIMLFFMVSCSNVKPNQEVIPSNYFEITDFNPKDTLFLVSREPYDLGIDFCYVNQKGDTIIPYGKYSGSFSDTILTYGIVIEKNGDQSDLIGVNQQGKRLYEVQWYDNGPDYLEDGLFRILQNGKTGYADATGKIVIQPVFACAFPFENGRAKVSYECELIKDLEYTEMKSDSWIYIDKKGQEIK